MKDPIPDLNANYDKILELASEVFDLICETRNKQIGLFDNDSYKDELYIKETEAFCSEIAAASLSIKDSVLRLKIKNVILKNLQIDTKLN